MPGDWIDKAACRDLGTRAFYPGPGEPNSLSKSICRGCPVQLDCLEHALAHDELGVWGGTDDRERREIRRRRMGREAV